MVVRAAALRGRSRGGDGAVTVSGASRVAPPAAPFRGIRPFRYADHAIFFAREEETRLLASLVAVYRGVFLYGDSGNGKSSLVNAGLFPEARRRGFEPVRVRVQPRTGEELVVEQVEASEDGNELLPTVLAEQDDDAARIVLSIAQFERRVRSAPAERRTLIVFDQFEEVLTLFDAAVDARDALAEMIVRLLREPLPVKLVFAFREDYLGRVKQLLSACPELVDQALRLGPPSADALEAIIRGPFERFPDHFDHELDSALARTLSMALAARFGTGEVSLSEVETVCLRLWQSDDPAALLAAKGVQGLLEDELGEALDALAPELRAAAVALLSEMVTSAGTRNVISAEDLRQRVRAGDHKIAPALLDEALERLERDSKLVRRERRRDLYLYEITSEFLVPWISRRREELRLTQERRRERRRLRIVATVCGAVLLVLFVTAVAVWALDQSATARDREADATSLALSTSSVLSPRPDIALALAFEGYKTRQRPEARSAVIRALRAATDSGLLGVLPTSDAVPALALSPDGGVLATASRDQTIRLWDPDTGRSLGDFRGHTGRIRALAFNARSDTLASAAAGDRIRLWSIERHVQYATLNNGGSVRALAFSPDDGTLAAAGDDGVIRMWDPRAKTYSTLRGHVGRVRALAFMHRNYTLASGGDDGVVRLWNTADGDHVLAGRGGAISAVGFSADDRTLAAASHAGGIRLWSRDTLKAEDFGGNAGRILAVAFSPDGALLATAGSDKTVRLWNLRTHEQIARLSSHTAQVTSLAFTPAAKTLVSTGLDGTVRFWRAATGSALGLPADDDVLALAFSPDGKSLATAGFDSTIRVWDPASRALRQRLDPEPRPIGGIAFSPDGESIASAGEEGVIRVQRLTERKVMRSPQQPNAVRGVAFSPDGKTIASAGWDRTVRLWNPVTNTERILRGHTDRVEAVAFSSDGRSVASASDDRTVRLWDVASGRQLGRSARQSAIVVDVAFSPDGRVLASAGDDGTVALFQARDMAKRAQLAIGTPALALAFGPRGGMLAVGAADNTIRLFDPETGAPLGRLTGHTSRVQDVAFSPDGRTLVSSSADGTVRIWDAIFWRSLEELRKTVCGLVLKNPTHGEWTQSAGGIRYRPTCP